MIALDTVMLFNEWSLKKVALRIKLRLLNKRLIIST